MTGVCVAGGGVYGGGDKYVQDRQPLKRVVRILLECILVLNKFAGT